MFKKLFNKLKILGIVPILLVLTSCDINDYLNLDEEIASKIFPNVWDFLVQFLAFIIMVILITIFAYKPIKRYVKKRQELLDKERDDTLKNKKESEETLLEAKETVRKSKEKATLIVEESKKTALEIKEKTLSDTKLEVEKMKLDATNDIEKQKEEALKEVKKETGELAILVSSKILEREVKEEDNKKIIDDFIND